MQAGQNANALGHLQPPSILNKGPHQQATIATQQDLASAKSDGAEQRSKDNKEEVKVKKRSRKSKV